MFDYRLGLATGIDLPIPEYQLCIHQPTIKEISLMGETAFLTGVQFLCINKNMYTGGTEMDMILDQITNFELFIQIMNEKQVEADKKQAVKDVLTLLFPNYKVIITPRSLLLNLGEVNVIIDEGNFEILQNLLQLMFCLNKTDQSTFNPGNDKAKEIANKLMKARKKVAQLKEAEGGDGSMFGQYLSILTVGLGSMSLKDCMDLTMYQLYDLVERYTLYINWDIDIRSRMAGAKNDKPVDNWMKNIH